MNAMARFEYSALSAAGDIVSGEVDGPDAAAVIERLHEQALLPIHAVEKRREKSSGFSFRLSVSKGLPGRELALFSQQLARLLKANLPSDRALEILTDLAAERRSGDVIRRTLERVRDGASLAEAMAAQGKSFPQAYVSMVRAGEASSGWGSTAIPALSRCSRRSGIPIGPARPSQDRAGRLWQSCGQRRPFPDFVLVHYYHR